MLDQLTLTWCLDHSGVIGSLYFKSIYSLVGKFQWVKELSASGYNSGCFFAHEVQPEVIKLETLFLSFGLLS